MEDVLAVYHRPYNPKLPVVCMDEHPIQLIKETCRPLPAAPGRPLRYDFEYERCGTANIFMFTEPLAGWRHPTVSRTKTALDWAKHMQWLLETVYRQADRVILVCDNLNTHTIGAFYEAFCPNLARQLVERLEIHFTPKHGSWLNVAEIELSVLMRQCLARRIGDVQTLREQVRAWSRHRNHRQKGVNWQFTTDDARMKLKRLYPQIQT